MIDDTVDLYDWHVVGRASEMGVDRVRAVRLLGTEIVLWRNGKGIRAWLDLCWHRGAKLSMGTVRDECLVCAYHGWCYDSSGTCRLVPGLATWKKSCDVFRFPQGLANGHVDLSILEKLK